MLLYFRYNRSVINTKTFVDTKRATLRRNTDIDSDDIKRCLRLDTYLGTSLPNEPFDVC